MQPQELKRELERCQDELKQHRYLLQEREWELAKIHTLKNDVEASLVQMHRLEDVYPQKASSLKRQIEEQTRQITQHKKKLREIDAELDHLGEEEEETVVQIKQDLFSEIQKHFPGSVAEYAATETQLKSASQIQALLIKQQQLLLPLHNILQQGAQIKLKGGFWDFLSGLPKAKLARMIHQAILVAEKAAPHISDPRFKLYLDKFLREAKHPSNGALYQGRFSELADEFSTLMSDLQEEIIQSNLEVASLELALDKWIDKYCC